MSSPTETIGGDSGTATLNTASVGQGLWYAQPASEVDESGEHVIATGRRAFSRRVGLQYGTQVILNSLPLLILDILAITATIIASRYLFWELGITAGIGVTDCLLPITSGFVLLNFELGLYPGVKLSPVEEMRRLAVSVTCIFVVWAVGVAVLNESLGIQRWFLLVVYLACLVVLPVCRSWLRSILGKHTKWGLPALVCGDDASAVRLYQWLADNRHLGLRPVGVIGDRDTLGASSTDDWYAGAWSDSDEIADRRRVFWAIVVPPEDKNSPVASLIVDYLYMFPHVHVLSELTGLPDHWNPQQLDGLTGIHLQQNLMLPLPRIGKRIMDIVLTLIGGLILLPLLFYIAVAVKMSSRGPVLYANVRIGRNGRRFKMWKFRSMFINNESVLEQHLEKCPELRDELEATQKLKRDPRVTRIGRFIRKTSLDELPQLWNVFCGDMSLVGPRPILLNEQEKYGDIYPLYTTVSPGITGLWQVSGRGHTSYDDRLQFVAYYVRNWSPWLDVYLLLKTIRIVLFGSGAY